MNAIITGASGGMGEFFAKNLAKRGYSVILVARRENNLKKIVSEITKKYNVNAQYEVADLSNQAIVLKLAKKYSTKNINLLINNARFGQWGYYEKQDIARIQSMINLNIVALNLLTHSFIKVMRQKGGIIINVASILGLIKSVPLSAVYGATKNYVYNFSRVVNYELKKTKSKVILKTLNPGQINTNWAKNAGKENNQGTNVEKFVDKVLKKLLDQNKDIVTYGQGALLLKLGAFLPWKIINWLSHIIIKQHLK